MGSKVSAGESQSLYNASTARLLGRECNKDLHCDYRGCSAAVKLFGST